MCGIAGILGPRADETFVKKMVAAIAHRGPDGEGIEKISSGIFGHRRLSIIDLSDAGRQPMTSGDGRFSVIFNGEIYNYKELRAELPEYPFRSETDTEVILAAWAKWGEQALERFVGIFAFAIADRNDGSVTLVRDRFGVKPLFYAEGDGSLFFASEIKALLAAGIPSRPNERAVADYLLRGIYNHTDETFFDGIRNVPPGHLLRRAADGRVTRRRKWYLPDHVRLIENLSDEEVIGNFRALFDDSLRLHLRSDVPVGINLSSGIDSLSLFYEYKRLGELKNLSIFTMGFEDPDADESRDIERLAKQEGVPFTRVPITPKVQEEWFQKTFDALDQPFGGLSTMAYTKLMAAAHDARFKVLLEGQGVDEMLAGYAYYQKPSTSGPLFQDGTSFIDTSCLDAAWVERMSVVKPAEIERPFSDDLRNAMYRDITATKLPRVLRFNDHLSMAFGIELRVPYLDHRIAEFAFSLPARWKIRDGQTKFLLRETMKGLVPEELRLKGKRPQSSPQSRWYKGPLADAIRAELRHPRVAALPFVNAEATRRAFEEFVRNPERTNSFFFWQIINLAHWFERFAPTR